MDYKGYHIEEERPSEFVIYRNYEDWLSRQSPLTKVSSQLSAKKWVDSHEGSSPRTLPTQGYIFLGESKLGPFSDYTEADSALMKLDFNNEEVFEGLLRKHGPAYLMLGLPRTEHYTLYHVTVASNVGSILTQGLLSSVEPYFTKQHELVSYGIYLGDSVNTVSGFLFDREPGEEPVELLEVKIPWNWTLWLDPETAELGAYLASTAGFYISKDPIPASWVKRAPESVKIEAERHWKWITRKD